MTGGQVSRMRKTQNTSDSFDSSQFSERRTLVSHTFPFQNGAINETYENIGCK